MQHSHPRSTLGRRRHAALRAVALALAGGCLADAACASLGGTLDTVQADQVQLRATRRVANFTGYQVHEMVLASGTTVREYATAAGRVFGVAWQGPVKPDLNRLLGASFPRFVAAAQAPHASHRMLALRADDLVVESRGGMRNFSGRAYLPALLPASVSPGDIL